MIAKTFAYHKPSDEGVAKIQRLRKAYSALLKVLHEEMREHTREFALALTNLETSCMWATKDVALNDPNSQILE